VLSIVNDAEAKLWTECPVCMLWLRNLYLLKNEYCNLMFIVNNLLHWRLGIIAFHDILVIIILIMALILIFILLYGRMPNWELTASWFNGWIYIKSSWRCHCKKLAQLFHCKWFTAAMTIPASILCYTLACCIVFKPRVSSFDKFAAKKSEVTMDFGVSWSRLLIGKSGDGVNSWL